MARTLQSTVAAVIATLGLILPMEGRSQRVSPAPSASTSTSRAETENSPILTPRNETRTAPPSEPRRRAVSGGVAAALAAASPKYTPPPPKREPTPESKPIDLRDIDKPKNTIVRLPEFVVREKLPPVFTERAIHTEKGLTEIAMRRYITDADRALNRFTLPLFGTSKESRALAMYAEDERLKNMADLEAAALNASKSDAAAGTYIRREAQKTYLRSSDYGWSSGPPK